MGGKRLSGKNIRKAAKRVPPGREADDQDRHLGWRFEQVDFGGKWGWSNLAPLDSDRLRQELAVFEREPLYKLRRLNWVKLIPVAEMKPDAVARLAEIDRDDEGLWQLHLNYNKWRVWGFLDNAMFYFLWWDPDHTVATGACRKRKNP